MLICITHLKMKNTHSSYLKLFTLSRSVNLILELKDLWPKTNIWAF